MARYWNDAQLDASTPPQTHDVRGKAALRALDQIIGARPVAEFHVRDAETCPASALPALIAEYSMEEFIDPGWPEETQRRILKNAWFLQTLEGYDDGVKLGLGLLGLVAEIEQWWQTDPKGPAHSHTVILRGGDQSFDPPRQFFTRGDVQDAHFMIEATKRFSQESHLRTEEAFDGNAHVSPALGMVMIDGAAMTLEMP